jgi:hypothetical protein
MLQGIFEVHKIIRTTMATIGGIVYSFWIMWQGCRICERQKC